MIKSISIIGCGWLGYPLAKSLIDNGYIVHGSTTSDEKISRLKEDGIMPYLFDLNQPVKSQNHIQNLLASDVMIITIPPRVRKYGRDYGKRQIENLLTHDFE